MVLWQFIKVQNSTTKSIHKLLGIPKISRHFYKFSVKICIWKFIVIEQPEAIYNK